MLINGTLQELCLIAEQDWWNLLTNFDYLSVYVATTRSFTDLIRTERICLWMRDEKWQSNEIGKVVFTSGIYYYI